MEEVILIRLRNLKKNLHLLMKAIMLILYRWCLQLEIWIIIIEGKIIAAAQEERFTRIKHDASFPKKAINLGANYLVIGRPITHSSNPLLEITNINSSIE